MHCYFHSHTHTSRRGGEGLVRGGGAGAAMAVLGSVWDSERGVVTEQVYNCGLPLAQ